MGQVLPERKGMLEREITLDVRPGTPIECRLRDGYVMLTRFSGHGQLGKGTWTLWMKPDGVNLRTRAKQGRGWLRLRGRGRSAAQSATTVTALCEVTSILDTDGRAFGYGLSLPGLAATNLARIASVAACIDAKVTPVVPSTGYFIT